MSALGYVLIVLALRSVKAEDSITCNGVTHLPAGRYTVSNCAECTIVGEPGTIINFPPSNRREFCSGALNLNGSLVLEGNPLMGQDDYCYRGRLSANGNVEIKDCKNLGAYLGLHINGGSSGQFLVSMANSSVVSDSPIRIGNNAKVKFTDCEWGSGEDSLFMIENSHVVFERVHAFSESSGYFFKNSTVIASNTLFEGGHPEFSASDSVLNFTNSSVRIYDGNFIPAITLSRCTLDVSCDSSTNHGFLPPHGNHVFSTDSGWAGSMGMDIIESKVHFERCSCHLDRAISVAGPLSIEKSSVTFGACSEFSGSTKAGESLPVVV